MQKRRVLITGGCGFLGRHVVKYFLDNTDWDLFVIDKLNYASDADKLLKDNGTDRLTYMYHDLKSPIPDALAERMGDIELIYHLAANSSVEYLIKNPAESVYDNVLSTVNVLEYARSLDSLKLMNYFSTDEVYGAVAKPEDGFDEEAPHKPSNPYSAGKAAGEDYAYAWHKTYNLPVFTSNTMNIFGHGQNKEKFLPTIMRCVNSGEELPVYSSKDGKVAGSRYWIYAYDVASALVFLGNNAVPGEKYHIVGTWSDNLELAKTIAKKMGKPLKYKMFDFHSSRPGHDLHYGLEDTKLGKMGWKLETGLDEGLSKIIKED